MPAFTESLGGKPDHPRTLPSGLGIVSAVGARPHRCVGRTDRHLNGTKPRASSGLFLYRLRVGKGEVFQLHPRLGRKEGPAPYGAGSEPKGLRLEAVE